MRHADLEGGCLCGAVRYRIDAEAAERRASATARPAAAPPGRQSVAWATVAGDGLRLDRRRARPRTRSSPGVVRTHCAACGTSLTFQSAPDSIDVTLASLDDPEVLPPTKEIWLSHRLSWEPCRRAVRGSPTAARTDGRPHGSTSAARIRSTTTSAIRLIRATRASSWWRTR